MSTRKTDERLLSGWGLTNATRSHTVAVYPDDGPLQLFNRTEVVSCESGGRGALARGLGRAYNDAAQNSGGTVLMAADTDSGFTFDREHGVVVARGGTTIAQIIEAATPLGWFVPVTPGTRYVTIGGAIAADVHGKNHHGHGSIGQHITTLTLDAPTGRHVLTPDLHHDQFWATVGGLGLTGVIREATIQLLRIESPLMCVHTKRAANLDDLLAYLSDDASTYSVAWVDSSAAGRHLGRSVITTGEHATAERVASEQRKSRRGGDRSFAVPRLPRSLVTPLTARVFNELTFRVAPSERVDELQTISRFFHPLDGVGHWNRFYGPRGFVQWQCALPLDQHAVLARVLEALNQSHHISPVTVLKRFGSGTPAPLSFPIPGWTLALDVPVSDRLGEVLDCLDTMVVEAGGRLYLAKDGRMRRELVPAMYPRLGEWRAWRDTLDPDRQMQSDLARRLDLLGDGPNSQPLAPPASSVKHPMEKDLPQ